MMKDSYFAPGSVPHDDVVCIVLRVEDADTVLCSEQNLIQYEEIPLTANDAEGDDGKQEKGEDADDDSDDDG